MAGIEDLARPPRTENMTQESQDRGRHLTKSARPVGQLVANVDHGACGFRGHKSTQKKEAHGGPEIANYFLYGNNPAVSVYTTSLHESSEMICTPVAVPQNRGA